MTGGSARGNYRPISPRGKTGADLNVVWMRGGYPSFTRYQTAIDAETLSRDAYDPSVVAGDVGRLQVLAGDGTGGLLRKSFPDAWSGWEDVGRGPAGHIMGPPARHLAGPAASTSSPSKRRPATCCTRPGSGGVWSDWTDRGRRTGRPPRRPAPAITSPGPGPARDRRPRPRHQRPAPLGMRRRLERASRVAATPGGAYTPSIESWAPGRLDVFAVTSTGGWPTSITPAPAGAAGRASAPARAARRYGSASAVTSWAAARLDVFAPSSGGRALPHRWFDGTGWRGPEALGTGADRIRCAASRPPPGRPAGSTSSARTPTRTG